METILPIVYEDVLIAYIQIGQFRDAEQRYSSSEKVQEVAEKYGFSDYNYFIKLFKKQFGITPLQFRKEKLL